MATLKTEAKANTRERLLEQLRKTHEEKVANSPVVAERWYVIEHFPAYDDWEGHWWPSRSKTASPALSSLEAAEHFIATHDPEEGSKFQIRHERLRRITTEQWVTW